MQAPGTESILFFGKSTVVALCDNGAAQLIVGQRNVIAHVNKALFGQFFAVKIPAFCKMQGRHGLLRQVGIIKLRAFVLLDEGHGLVLRGCR